jgi:hypothetical protein
VATCPTFFAKNFPNPTRIDNPFFPLIPGTTFVYSGVMSGQPQNDIFNVTERTKAVDHITALVIKDLVYVAGQLTERTFDYFAQDRAGNVWYMGEHAEQIAHGIVVGTNGSWLAGVHGAQPGFVMLAHPDHNDSYCQENFPGVAQDQARVLGVHSPACVPAVCVRHSALLTNETSPLEPGTVELKWYVRGIGNVMAMDVRGGQDQIGLVTVFFHPT